MHLRPMCRGRSSSCSCSGVLTHPRTVTPLAPDVAVERDGDRPADHDFHQVEVPVPVLVPAVVHPNRAGDVLRIPNTGDDALVEGRFQRGRCSRHNRRPPAARSSPTRYPVQWVPPSRYPRGEHHARRHDPPCHTPRCAHDRSPYFCSVRPIVSSFETRKVLPAFPKRSLWYQRACAGSGSSKRWWPCAL